MQCHMHERVLVRCSVHGKVKTDDRDWRGPFGCAAAELLLGSSARASSQSGEAQVFAGMCCVKSSSRFTRPRLTYRTRTL